MDFEASESRFKEFKCSSFSLKILKFAIFANELRKFEIKMENYIVSARKYRPDTFESVVSQKSLTTTLKNAIQTGKLAHAYLFCGPRGVGKTTCARIFAKTINCQALTADGEPCNECESCRSFNEQRSYSIYELDAASNNSVEDIRSLNEQVRIPPQVGKYKVYIIDEVHMLSQAAFNAFLKTLEEPPAHAIFILATTEKHKIIPTILSRCQIYDFSRIDVADIISHLQNIAGKENINTEYEALRIIAQKSDGCMRDALSLFDQMASFTQGDLTYNKVIESLNVLDYEYYFRLTDFILEKKISQCLLLFNEILNKGFDGNIFIEGAASHFRDLLVNSDEATTTLFEGSAELRNRYIEQARRCKPQLLFKAIKLCNNCCMNYRTSRNKRLLVELTLIELVQCGDNDSDDGSGRSPKILKPIFSSLAKSEVAMPQAKNEASVAKPAQAVTESPRTIQRPVTATAEPQTVTPPTMQGRPVELQTRRSEGTSLGGMFRKSRSIMGTTDTNRPATTISTNTTIAEKIETRKTLTNELIGKAWTSVALQLPENERALADRMKLIVPSLGTDNTFTISVDNQMVAELFEREAPRIIKGMRSDLGDVDIKMAVNVNKVVIERHVSDKGKQYEILKEKNPLIEKLRVELNLELAR